MKPLHWRELQKIFYLAGCVDSRQRGDHHVMTRPGLARPVVFKMVKDLSNDIVLSVRRTLGLSKQEFDALVDIVQKKNKR